MRESSGWIPIAALLLVGASTLVAEDPSPPVEARGSDLVEQTRRTLVQLDVTVEGPPAIVAGLSSEDFVLNLGGRKIREFTVDRFCQAPADAQPEPDAPSVPAAEEAVVAAGIRGVNYLFYFDQHHLTFRGRNRSIELAHELIDDLIRDGNKATIVSSGLEMRTFASLTDDRSALHEAVDRLDADTKQVDTFPMQEDARVENVLEELAAALDAAALESSPDARLLDRASTSRPGAAADSGSTLQQNAQERAQAGIQDAYRTAFSTARHVARDYQREEWWRTDRALTQFSLALGTMANHEFPKAAIYFADTVRANAGEHYMGMLGDWDVQATISAQALGAATAPRTGTTPSTIVPGFDRVIEEAAAHGVRLYTIQAEGLKVGTPMTRLSNATMAGFGAATPGSMNRRFSDAEGSLVSFAAETGGQAFLRGMSAERIAEEILGDMDCVYLLSFDAERFKEDRPLPVKVSVKTPDVAVRARGLMTIRSESARLTARLMAAFAAPDEVRGEGKLVGVMIPTGFDEGKYTALAQLIVPGSPQPQVEWDVGISVVSESRVRNDASGRVSVRGSDVPVVFETVVELEPGPWEMTGVAHDSVTGGISAFHVAGAWPDPKDERATVGPIALMQPMYAAFLRDGATRREGSLGRAEKEPVRTDLPTALVGLVCRSRSQKGALSVDRRLVGETFVEFPRIDLADSSERCAVVTDVIPAGTMTAGMFQYELTVRSDGEDVASGVRALAALDPGGAD